MDRRMIDMWVDGKMAKVGVDRDKLAAFGVAGGMDTLKEIVWERAGLSWRMIPDSPEKDDSNITMENWLKEALAVGRHPFDIGYVILPDSLSNLTPPSWPSVVFNADREVWGFSREEIEALLESGEAHFRLDRRKMDYYWRAGGGRTRRALSALAGVNVVTLQNLSKPDSNPQCNSWMRIALAVGVHPYAIADVKLPGVQYVNRLPVEQTARTVNVST